MSLIAGDENARIVTGNVNAFEMIEGSVDLSM